MAEKEGPPPPGLPAVAPLNDDAGEAGRSQWEQLLQAYAKSGNMASTAPFMNPAMPYPMNFSPAAYMFPMMNFASMQAMYSPGGPGAEAAGKPPAATQTSEDDGSLTEDELDQSVAKDGKRRGPRIITGTDHKRPKSGGSGSGGAAAAGMGVKSNSQAALALLASTAGGVDPAIVQQQQQLQQQNMLTEMWGQFNGNMAAAAAAAAAMGGTGTSLGALDPGAMGVVNGNGGGGGGGGGAQSRGTDSGLGGDDFDEAQLAGLDDREIKRLRRKQSNRESARRSRLRKQAECEHLQEANRGLMVELQQLRNEKVELNAQIAILQAKLAMSTAFGTMQQQQAQQQQQQQQQAQLPVNLPTTINQQPAPAAVVDQADQEGDKKE